MIAEANSFCGGADGNSFGFRAKQDRRRWESRIQRCHRGDQVLVVRLPALDCLAAVGPGQHLQSARLSRRDMLAAGIPAVTSRLASWSSAERGSLQLNITRPWRLACSNVMQLSSSPVERRSVRSRHRPPRGAPQRRALGVYLPGPGGRGPSLLGHRVGCILGRASAALLKFWHYLQGTYGDDSTSRFFP